MKKILLAMVLLTTMLVSCEKTEMVEPIAKEEKEKELIDFDKSRINFEPVKITSIPVTGVVIVKP